MTVCDICGQQIEEHVTIRGDGRPPRSFWVHIGPDEQRFYIDQANRDHDARPPDPDE